MTPHELFVDLLHLGPELTLVGGCLLLLVIGAFQKIETRAFAICLWGVVIAMLCGIGALGNATPQLEPLMGGLLQLDGFIVIAKILLLAVSAFVLLLARPYLMQEPLLKFEIPILFGLSTAGMLVMVGAQNFLTVYLGLELQSFCLYILAASKRDARKPSEAALKYFALGALASGLMLYGMSLLYGYAGTTGFGALQTVLQVNSSTPMAVVGMVLLLCGLIFKLAAAPFHMWAPDVYQGAPTPVTAFFAIVAKLAASFLLLRVLYGPLSPLFEAWQQVLIVVAALSVIVGAFGALRQTDIKRLLAYGGVGHAGYILLAILTGTADGAAAAVMYLLLYAIASIGMFAVIMALRRQGKTVTEISGFSGLAQTHPWLALGFAICTLSMAGLPPFGGFFAKLMVFRVVVDSGFLWLAVLGVVMAVVAAAYYLRLVKVVYFDAPAATAIGTPIMPTLRWLPLLTSFVLLLYIVWPAALWDLAQAATITLSFR